MINCKSFAIVVWVLAALVARADETQFAELQSMELKSIDGAVVSLADAKLRVFCVLGTECPVSRFYVARLDELSKQYADQGVRFVGIHSNMHDSAADVQKFVKELGVSFPQVHDGQQVIARQLKASRVPEVILIDADDKLRYSGRIDDQYAPGVKRSNATSNHLRNAIDAVLAGKEPAESRVDPVGCLITFAKQTTTTTDITYCRTIAPLFNEHCVECHRAGEIGTFDITNYDEVRGWAEMIVEVVEEKRMPPWHADPRFGAFKNQRHMPDSALAVLKEWVKAGTPYGDKTDLPPQPKFINGWRLEKDPELVVAMRDKPYTIPASGTVEYQYFVVDPKISEDRWVSSAQIIPGNASVVHHAIVFVRPPDGVDFAGIGWLTAYVPGQRATIFPPGFARKIPAGSKLVFQMHYTPNGQVQADTTQIGMTFMDANEVTHEVFTMIGIDQEFEIPAGESNHVVKSSVNRLPQDGVLLAVSPHMHLRGKSFEMVAVAGRHSASEDRSTLLKVPQYDFNWQHTYELAEPLRFSELKSLELTTTFDNSKNNPFNPDPEQYVVWGEQTWEEMSVAFLEVAKPLEQGTAPSPPANPSVTVQTVSNIVNEPTAGQVEYAENFLKKFDVNHDGTVIVAEVPRIVKDYSFNRIDQDGDGSITRDELIAAARTKRGK
jgi:thiol-disulfide isomerase/thioredoxin